MNLTEQQKELIGGGLAVVILITLAVVWWASYVRPRDQFLGQVMDCMEDGSEAEYQRCAEIVRAEVSDSHSPVRPQ